MINTLTTWGRSVKKTTDSPQGARSPTPLLKKGDLRRRLTRKLFDTSNADLTREVHELKGVVTTLQKKLEAVAPIISTNQTHLDPSNLCLRLTSRSSYGRSHKSETDPSYQPEHLAKSESYLRREKLIEGQHEFVSHGLRCHHVPGIPNHFEEGGACVKHFVSNRTRRKNSASLLNVVQERNESLSRYLGRFNAATLEIDNLDESVKYTAFMRGLRPTTKFAFAVNKSPPGNMSGLLDKANKYIQAEEYLETHKEHRGDNGQGRDERRPKEMFDMKNLTPLNARPSQILHGIKDKEILKRPEKMRSAPREI
ncbi:hypothetical protein RJ639_031802 [Escallonia herrerae]|uniref:Retrotransposon gag domain-containing protein n=1 Tax=Escallonia herrerae TaxID=1293975 RepID=A0AA88X0Y9_9ASTE|nr:hypothetical protein RJ639_031802 [Escallonia herrerae]